MIIQLFKKKKKKRNGSSFFTGTSANFSLFLKARALGFTVEKNKTLKYIHNEGNPSIVNNTSKKLQGARRGNTSAGAGLALAGCRSAALRVAFLPKTDAGFLGVICDRRMRILVLR